MEGGVPMGYRAACGEVPGLCGLISHDRTARIPPFIYSFRTSYHEAWRGLLSEC